jgi:hypothetical protein
MSVAREVLQLSTSRLSTVHRVCPSSMSFEYILEYDTFPMSRLEAKLSKVMHITAPPVDER